MPICSSALTANLRSSGCSTEHPPCDLFMYVLVGPIRMPGPQCAFDDKARGPVSLENHFELFGGSFFSENLRDGVVNDFDIARIQTVAKHWLDYIPRIAAHPLRGGCNGFNAHQRFCCAEVREPGE